MIYLHVRVGWVVILSACIQDDDVGEEERKKSSWGFDLPRVDLHGTLFEQVDVHLESLVEHVGFVTTASGEALLGGVVKVVLQERLVVRVSALVNDDLSTVARAQATEVSETLLGDDDVEVVFGLVDVGGEGHDARDTGWVVLAGTGRRRVHDAQLRVAQEVGRATQTVEHTGAADQGRIGMSINVDFDRRVHGNAAQTANDLGRVADLLRAQQEAVLVLGPVLVEPLKALGREPDRRRTRELELVRVEEFQKGVLKHFGKPRKGKKGWHLDLSNFN